MGGPDASNSSSANGSGVQGDFESLKQEILGEVRREIQKAKTEIIEGEGSSVVFSVCFNKIQ